MKNEHYTRLICEKACSFYKPGKEDLLCEGYRYLARTYSPEELARLLAEVTMNFHMQQSFQGFIHEHLQNVLCERCDFRIDGCDFAEDCSGPPCGGYRIMHCLSACEAQNREEENDALGK